MSHCFSFALPRGWSAICSVFAFTLFIVLSAALPSLLAFRKCSYPMNLVKWDADFLSLVGPRFSSSHRCVSPTLRFAKCRRMSSVCYRVEESAFCYAPLGAWSNAHGRGCARGSPVSLGCCLGVFLSIFIFCCSLSLLLSLICHGARVHHAFHWHRSFGGFSFLPIALCLAHSLGTSPGVQGCPLCGGLLCRMFSQHPAVPHFL